MEQSPPILESSRPTWIMPSVTQFDLLADPVLKRIDLEKVLSNLICPITCFERGQNFAKHFLFPSFPGSCERGEQVCAPEHAGAGGPAESDGIVCTSRE